MNKKAEKVVGNEIYLPHVAVYFLVCLKYQSEDDPKQIETCSWLNYYFYKVVFLKVVNLPLSPTQLDAQS